MSSLYICYQSLLDPLTISQVVAYLEGLADVGHEIHLMTFESSSTRKDDAIYKNNRARLSQLGITWHVQRYHKRPTVPATAFDVACGIAAGRRIVRRHNIRLIHARGHVPGLIGLGLKRLTRVKLLFDIRGLMAEEYVDAGIWPHEGRLFRATKWVERRLVRAADGLVVLTHSAVDLLRCWYADEMHGKPLEVVPCCVDLRKYHRARSDNGETGLRLVYVGKLGGWYLTEDMAEFAATAARTTSDFRFTVWTQCEPGSFHSALKNYGINREVSFGSCPPESIAAKLSDASAGLSFRPPTLASRAASPTKIAEYLAAGLPVVSTAGVGDTDAVLCGNGDRPPVGVLVKEMTQEAYATAIEQLQELLRDPNIAVRCRSVARQYFHLEQVGWTRYRRLYDALLNGTQGES